MLSNLELVASDPGDVFSYSSLVTPIKLISHDGFFLGYGNSMAVMICYKPKTKCIVRCRHAIIDEHGETLQTSDQPLTLERVYAQILANC